MYDLSVVIPVYNTEKYLEECINSVLQQSLKNVEIILVDDDSPDGAGIMCDLFEKKYTNVRVIHKKNGGLGLARNTGLQAATGTYVAFLDSDDYVAEDYYQTLVDTCKKNRCDICFGNGYISFNENLREEVYYSATDEVVDGNYEIRMRAPRIIGATPYNNDLLAGTSTFAVYKRDFLVANNIEFISERTFISEDVWFNLTNFEVANRICYVNSIGYCYRYNNNSLSRGYNPNRFELLSKSVEMLLQRCEDMKLTDYKNRVAFYFWGNFEKCINQEVRFSGKHAVNNIKKMLANGTCRKLINTVANDKSFKGLHAFLCKLLVRGNIVFAVFLLRIYNLKKDK